MPARTIALVGALWLASSPVAAQSHDLPKVVPTRGPAPAAPTPGSPHAPIPAAPSAAPDHAPVNAAKPTAVAATPVKLGDVRGRINAALAAMPAPPGAARPRRPAAATAAAPPPRYQVRWPEARWHVQWRPAAERLTVSWPDRQPR